MKRLPIIALLLICLITPIFGGGFVFHCLEAYPTQLYLIWSAVEGADYYDIYLDRAPLKRVQEGTMAFIGTEDEPLESQRTYEVLVIARQKGDKDLGYLSERITTTERYHEEFIILAAHPWPNQIDIFWTMVEEAQYYDIYLDRIPIKRVWGSFSTTIGSNEQPLLSNRSYEIMIIARKEGDIQIDRATTEVTTIGWDGHYRWVNETKKDNKGKVRQLDFRVTYIGDSYRIDGLYDRWHTIFPLVPASQIGKIYSFEGESAVQQAYRENAQTFNTSKIRPETWSVASSWEEGNSMGVDVRSRAKGINVSTYSTFTFLLNESRGSMLYFETSADGIAALSIFRSPNSGDDGIFKAKLISSQI